MRRIISTFLKKCLDVFNDVLYDLHLISSQRSFKIYKLSISLFNDSHSLESTPRLIANHHLRHVLYEGQAVGSIKLMFMDQSFRSNVIFAYPHCWMKLRQYVSPRFYNICCSSLIAFSISNCVFSLCSTQYINSFNIHMNMSFLLKSLLLNVSILPSMLININVFL